MTLYCESTTTIGSVVIDFCIAINIVVVIAVVVSISIVVEIAIDISSVVDISISISIDNTISIGVAADTYFHLLMQGMDQLFQFTDMSTKARVS